ncbi:MAG TPA: hypothetical protein VGI82_04170 [Chitinophagaceae bacterium]|jgi:hypothetical protein
MLRQAYYNILAETFIEEMNQGRDRLTDIYLNINLNDVQILNEGLFNSLCSRRMLFLFTLSSSILADLGKEQLSWLYCITSLDTYLTNEGARIILLRDRDEHSTIRETRRLDDFFLAQGSKVSLFHFTSFTTADMETQEYDNVSILPANFFEQRKLQEQFYKTVLHARKKKLIIGNIDFDELPKTNDIVDEILKETDDILQLISLNEDNKYERHLMNQRADLYLSFLTISKNIREKEYFELLDWYNHEYEILPTWYKRIGHVIKVIMGKRTFRSLFNDNVKKRKD